MIQIKRTIQSIYFLKRKTMAFIQLLEIASLDNSPSFLEIDLLNPAYLYQIKPFFNYYISIKKIRNKRQVKTAEPIGPNFVCDLT